MSGNVEHDSSEIGHGVLHVAAHVARSVRDLVGGVADALPDVVGPVLGRIDTSSDAIRPVETGVQRPQP